MKQFLIITLFALIFCSSTVKSACAQNTEFQNSQCYCKKGYYGTQEQADTQGCIECPSNSSSFDINIGGVDNCSRCKAGYYIKTQGSQGSHAQCVPCPNNSTRFGITQGDSGIQNCFYCQKGYFLVAEVTDTESAQCQKCENGTTTFGIDQMPLCDICIDDYYKISQIPKSHVICTNCPANSQRNNNYEVDAYNNKKCNCNDQYAVFEKVEDVFKCVCQRGYTGSASPENPCVLYQEKYQSTEGNLLRISVFIICLALSI